MGQHVKPGKFDHALPKTDSNGKELPRFDKIKIAHVVAKGPAELSTLDLLTRAQKIEHSDERLRSMVMETNDARRLSPRAQEDLRRRVVRAVVDRGMTQVETVDTFGVSRTSVHHWVKAYRQRGAKALTSKPRGRPKNLFQKGS